MTTQQKKPEPVAFGAKPTEARPEWALSDERLDVFSYFDENGEPATVTMPARPNPGLALEFLRQGRQMGPELATSWLIAQAIGEDGYDVLVSELSNLPEGIDATKILADIGTRVQLAVMGGLSGPKA